MQSFYFTNEPAKVKNLDTYNSFLNLHPPITKNDFSLNLFYSENCHSFYEENGNFISNLGVFIYKKQWNNKAIRLFYEDFKKLPSLDRLLLSEDVHGQFLLILYYENRFFLITDRLGYFSAYCYMNGKTIDVSNSILILAKNNKTTLSNQGIAEYLSENYRWGTYACCDKNIFEEIEYLDAGSIYTFDKEVINKQRYFNVKEQLEIGKYKDPQEIANKAEEILSDNLSFLHNVEVNIHSDITGGIDTRLNLALMMRNKIDISCGIQAPIEYKNFANTGKYSEYKIASQIAEHYNLDLKVFGDDNYNKNKELIDGITFNLSNKQTYNRRTGYFMQLRKDGIGLMVSGLSGTELFRQSYLDYFNVRKDLDLYKFLRQYVEFIDIMHNDFLKEKDYYEHLTNFYNKNLQGLKYDLAEDLVCYMDYFAFYKTHFCRYVSLANSFIPFYTPYGDYRLPLLMYQTAYKAKERFNIQRRILTKINPYIASLNSTRGFPLCKVTPNNIYRFYHMLDKNIPQQYFSPLTKFSNWGHKTLIQTLFKNQKLFNNFLANSLGKQESKKKNLWSRPTDLSIINFHNSLLKEDLPVFNIISKNKLSKIVKRDCNYNVINRVLNLNQILMDTGHS